MRTSPPRLIVSAALCLALAACRDGSGSSGGARPGGGPPKIPIEAPRQVAALTTNSGPVLTWQRMPGVLSYNVYMAARTGVTKSNVSALPRGTVFRDVTPPFPLSFLRSHRGTTYFFTVTAIYPEKESPESEEVRITVGHAAGRIVALAAGDSHSLVLNSNGAVFGGCPETR